jgi:DinB superfamily
MAAQVTAALPAWSVRLLAELNAADERAKALATGLSTEQLNWRPTPDAWSVGQCLEHLCITNELYLAAISSSFPGESSLPVEPVSPVQEITPGRFSRWFITSFVEPSAQTKRARAPKKILPGPRVESAVLDRFLRSNQAARHVVRHAGNYDVNRIRFRNPFIPLLRFTVGAGLEIVSKHESRHLVQGEQVRRSANFPGSKSNG